MELKRLQVPFAIDAQSKASVAETGEFSGHGSVFGNLDLGGDIVVRGAFAQSLDSHQRRGTVPIMLWQHQPDRVPGKWVEVREDARGLYVKGALANTPLGQEVRELLKMGAVAGLSIGYRTVVSDYDRDGNRLLKQVELHEVSVVSFPMNPAATVTSAKAPVDAVANVRDLEQLWRYLGVSRRKSAALATRCWPHFSSLVLGGEADTLTDIRESLNDAAQIAQLEAIASRIRSL